MLFMAASKTGATPGVEGPGIQDIFRSLSEGVDDESWQEHADVLRIRGFSVFDLRIAGSGDIEIISPDCLNWWQIGVGGDGCWRLH